MSDHYHHHHLKTWNKLETGEKKEFEIRLHRQEPLERPWLLDFWLEVDASAASDSTLWSLAGALPPRLLSPGTEAQVQQLAALVQDRWRHSLVQGACLPWNVMDHLERALGRQRLQRGLDLHLPCLEFARHLHQVLDAPFPVVFDPPFSL